MTVTAEKATGCTLLRSGAHAACIGQNGELLWLEDSQGGRFIFSGDRVVLTTGRGSFSTAALAPVSVTRDTNSVAYRFPPRMDMEVTLRYSQQSGTNYLERSVEVRNLGAEALPLLEIILGASSFSVPPQKIVDYSTFWYAPTVCFLRWEDRGIFTGIENPFFRVRQAESGVALSFAPSMLLSGGEEYRSEPQFLGCYLLSGETLRDVWPRTLSSDSEPGDRPRFRNPCGHISLDRNEIRAMQRFAADYLSPGFQPFTTILYCFWYPIEQLPDSSEAERAYLDMIDRFAELGGEMIVFNPLCRYQKPDVTGAQYWELAPEGSCAERILRHAREKGIRYGFYMGVATPPQKDGNACALDFAPGRQDWKKTDAAGNIAEENCLASEEYCRWWALVQKNTIEKYSLGYWSWDPGPGNGNHCYSSRHGHLPGEGGYLGWRRSVALVKELHEAFPALHLMSFYGRKEYGLWGLRYFSQHESYWEQTILFGASIYPELHDDRMNADGVRLQNWWNMNFRFLPAAMGHGLVHRIGEHTYDPRLAKVWDQGGWKYALLSAIACCGSVTLCALPEAVSPEMKRFYRKWTGWAKRNAALVPYTVPFGAQVEPGKVDGYARIHGRHGFVFLCNPGSEAVGIEFRLDEALGLNLDDAYTLRQLHPDRELYYDPRHCRGIFRKGDVVYCAVPPFEIMVLELSPAGRAGTMVFGLGGKVEGKDSIPRVCGATGLRGTRRRFAVLTEIPLQSIAVNSQSIALQRNGDYLTGLCQFSGNPLPRTLTHWLTTAGAEFQSCWNGGAQNVTLTASFFADPAIRTLLKAARPENAGEVAPLLRQWDAADPPLPFSFVWARPDRLWLGLPLKNANRVRSVKLSCNQQPVEVRCFTRKNSKIIHYCDLTEAVSWGEENILILTVEGLESGQFLSPYLDYPQQPRTGWVIPCQSTCILPEPQALASGAAAGSPPHILWGELTPQVLCSSGGQFTVRAAVQEPPEALRGVYISLGFLPEELALTYQPDSGDWVYTGHYGARQRNIMDSEASYLWALDRSGCPSKVFPIPHSWSFAPPETQEN